jgi:hypothetical protein
VSGLLLVVHPSLLQPWQGRMLLLLLLLWHS